MMMPEHLPPDVQAAIEASRRLAERMHDEELAGRRDVLRWAAILCTCRAWPDPEQRGTPPQAGCVVHGSVLVTMTGEVL